MMSETENNLEKELYDDRLKVITGKIGKLRLKLLDLTRRNPLVSVNLSDKSGSNIRVADEVLSFLFDELKTGKMRISSLPALEDQLKDESSREFHDALSEAHINDEAYLREIDAINQNDEKAADLLAKAERNLKDRIREKLKMPQRQTKANLSIQQHAINHDINPHYELPLANEKHQDGRHNDKDIQTLLLPDVLERKLNALSLKDRDWKQEVGINVLYAGFGFLEWKENINSEKSYYSPLVLLPIELEKRRSGSGQEFWISAEDATPEWNMTLAEKLRIDYGILLPKYEEGQSIEEYFTKIEDQKPKGMEWKLRRWVVMGVFPSAKLSMYHDLDPSNGWNLLNNPTISSLFGGSSDVGQEDSAFGDEYNIDDPEIESKLPLLITDADSSQFSTIVDILDGKNLAVEGPPGTGKSQTIVNTIAASLAQGKKVMFVAEKSAALEVVRSRLEKFGLGNFLLPLQATRSSKEHIISSIRDRIEARFPSSPRELEELKASFNKTRDDLNLYIRTLSSGFGESEHNVYQILGRAIALRSAIDSLPQDLQSYNVPIAQNISKSKSEEIIALLKTVEEAWLETNKNDKWWKDVGLANIDPFSVNEVLNTAEEVAKSYYNSDQLRAKLQEYDTDIEASSSSLSEAEAIVKSLPKDLKDNEIVIVEKLDSQVLLDDVKKFLNESAELRSTKEELDTHLKNSLAHNIAAEITEIAHLLEKHDISSITNSYLKQELSKRESEIMNLKEALNFLLDIKKASENLIAIPSKHIVSACKILENISREALLLRSENLIDPDAQIVIEKGRKQVDSLLNQRELLKDKILFTIPVKKEEVAQNILILDESGILGIISSQYRQAKKFYGKISCVSKFNKKQAIADMRAFEGWLSEVEELNSNQKLQGLLGSRFDGLDTKFEPYFEVFSFFANIDQKLSYPDCFVLKNLLRSGNSDVLFSFPKLTDDHPIHSFPDINAESCKACVEGLETELKDIKQAISYIEKTADNLHSRDDWDADKLHNLSSEVNTFQNQWQKISNSSDMQELLGVKFFGAETKQEDLKNILQIASQIVSIEQRPSVVLAMKKKQLEEFCNVLNKILSADLEASSTLERLSTITNTSPEIWTKNKTHKQIADYLHSASQDKSGLIAFSYLVGGKNDVEARGYGDFLNKVFKNYTPPCNITKIFKSVLARSMAQEVYKKYGSVLSKFNGIKLSSLRKQLADLDIKIIELSRQYLQAKLSRESYPPQGNRGNGRKSEYTEMEMLKHQIGLTRSYAPMREITKRAGKALLEIKPCWMMSPLAVSNYIPKDTIEFDLLIIDEASQMTPENSLGALLRAKQVMVVGDVNQLPPSNFFGKNLGDEEESDDEITTEASILEMASSIFSPRRRLRWHYRSRHSGLIAFSNRYIYDNDLVVFPSADEDNPAMGVSYKKVDGFYSTGLNPEESKVMVDAIVDFMSKYPDQSLGVVTMNQKQTTLLNEEMDRAFDKNPLAREYKEKWKNNLEDFFIKNLENVQGDERDVIFIGTVYGPEKVGSPVMQRFGPINGVAGRRRLNVLFSRAKKRIVTFSSMNTTDIKADEDSGNPGVYMLKQWLEYCATGRIQSGKITNKDTDSEFEDHVVQQIRSMGCDAIPQVGVVGYSIDIGVRHPDWPHGFIMGVECDGAAYHSSKSARDRDRLRQQVLEGLGWNLYRIWSTDWFDDPIRETEKLRVAIQKRMIDLKAEK